MKGRTTVLAVAFAVLAVVGACSSDQDPGLTPEDSGPGTTSHTPPVCSTAPDATIPVGGCLDSDGSVVNPDAAP